MRGAEANHTLVLVDGVEVSDPTTGETDFGLWSGLEAQRIEVVRGEQSVLYGSDAIGGVISVISGGDGLRGAVETGSRATSRAVLGYGADLGAFNLGGSISGFTTEGVDTAGLNGEKDGSDAWSAVLRGGTELGGDWQLNALARFGESRVETDPDLDFDGRLDSADRETDSEQLTSGLSAMGSTGLVSHILRASYGRTIRENSADGAYADETIGERTKLSWSPGVNLDAGSVTHAINAVIDHEIEDYERKSVDVFFGDPNQSQTFTTTGAALEYRFAVAGFSASASARYDDNDGRFENATTWRAGAAYAFAFGGKVWASAGEGVKNPTFTELFGYYPGSFVGNPDLEPERSASYEIGWTQSIDGGSVSASWFSAQLEDEIFTVFNPDWTSSAANREGESERSGVEVSGNWSPTDRLSFAGSATWVDSTDSSGLAEIRVPEWTGSLSATIRDARGDKFSLAADYVGEQGDTDFGIFQPVTLDAYTLVSATVEVPVSKHGAFTFRAENLLDEEVTDVFGYHGPGAGFFVGFRLR